MSYILSCCSTADLSKEHFKARNIHYLCFHYSLDGVEYPDDLGESIPFDKFYEAIAKGADTKTSQISISEYLEYFEGFLAQGQDVLHVCLSTGISGTANSAMDAARIARERYPDRKVLVVDSLGASSGYGLLMDGLADKRDEGYDLDALYRWAEDNKLRVHHWFFSTTLEYYIRGGRISKAAGWFGTALNICPLLNMDDLGRLIPRNKIRGKKKVIEECVKRMEQHAAGGRNYNGKCYISMSACMEDARAVAALVEKRFPRLNGKVEINSIGTTIGAHTGPGTVALFFWGDTRLGQG